MYTNFATNLEIHFIEYLSQALEEIQKVEEKEILIIIGPRKVGKTFISLYLKGEQFDKINDDYYSKLELKVPNHYLPPINNMNQTPQHPFQVVHTKDYNIIDLTGFNGKDFEISTFINCQIIKRLKKQMRILLVIDESFLKNKIDEKAFLKYLEYSLGINDDLLQLKFGIVINKVKDIFKKKEEQQEFNCEDIKNYLKKRLGLHAKYEIFEKQDYFQDLKDKLRFFQLFSGDIFTIMHTDKQVPSIQQMKELRRFVDNLVINNLNEYTIQENPSLTNLFSILLKKYSEQTQDRIMSKMSRQRNLIKELCLNNKVSDEVYNSILKKFLYYITENKQFNRLKIIQKISQLNPNVKQQIDQNVKSSIKQYTDTFSVHQDQILARLEQNNQDVQKKINKLKQINIDLEKVKEFILNLLKQVPKAPQLQDNFNTSESIIVKKLVQTNQLITKFSLNFQQYQEIIQVYKLKLREYHHKFGVVNKLQKYFHKIIAICHNDFDYKLNKNDYAIQDQWKNYENAQIKYKELTYQIKPQATMLLDIINQLLDKFQLLQEAEAIYSCLNNSELDDLRQIAQYIKELRMVFMEQVNEDYNNKMKVDKQKQHEPRVKYLDQQK